MNFQASLLSEGTEGYGDARSRALYSQVMLRTFGQHGTGGVSYGAMTPDQIQDVAKAGVTIGSSIFSAIGGAIGKGKEKKAAAAAAAEEERAARQAAKAAEEAAKVEAAQAAQRSQMLLLGVGALTLVGVAVTAIIITRKKADASKA